MGWSGTTLRLLSAERDGFSQVLTIEHDGNAHQVRLPLVGAFQASNALVAAGLVMATGASAATVLPALQSLRGARGRLDLAGTGRGGAPVFIDYAHTPDALAKALDALRPMSREGSSSCSAAAAIATRASAPRWERSRLRRPIAPLSPTTIRAAKPRGNQAPDLWRRARSGRDRRPCNCDRGGDWRT